MLEGLDGDLKALAAELGADAWSEERVGRDGGAGEATEGPARAGGGGGGGGDATTTMTTEQRMEFAPGDAVEAFPVKSAKTKLLDLNVVLERRGGGEAEG